MKVWIISEGEYYAFKELLTGKTTEAAAIRVAEKLVAVKNERKMEWCKTNNKTPEEYAYFFKQISELEWSNNVDFIQIEEIEIGL